MSRICLVVTVLLIAFIKHNELSKIIKGDVKKSVITPDKIQQESALGNITGREVDDEMFNKILTDEAKDEREEDDDDEEEEEEDEDDDRDTMSGLLNSKERREEKGGKGPKIWDQWSKWSGCSVTCGIGKMTRWRHCVSGGCAAGEKEAQIKTCTLPAC